MSELKTEFVSPIITQIINADPVVKCKDCKYYRDNVGECEYVWEHQGVIVDVLEDDFCSRGEKR